MGLDFQGKTLCSVLNVFPVRIKHIWNNGSSE